jgi:TM2 domain-containing membrane protein YozV
MDLALRLVVLVGIVPSAVAMLGKEMFTTNAICKAQYCINPVFPGVQDLGRLENSKWTCQEKQDVLAKLSFCHGAIDYTPALPAVEESTTSESDDIDTLVRAQDAAAITAFAYHLSGMGLEAWDHTRPSEGNECVKSIWRMVCYTYFPMGTVGCKAGQETKYLRPCRTSCQNYIHQCGVECCDESVQCVFSHDRPINETSMVKVSGYSNAEGPSPYCTGAASSRYVSRLLLLALAFLHISMQTSTSDGHSAMPKLSKIVCLTVLVAVALMVQGCEMDRELDMPSHNIGNWQRSPNYLLTYEFIAPGRYPSQAVLNSCDIQLSSTLQCSGRGICKAWYPDDITSDMNFCDCNRDWADPECRTPRKSQSYAYCLSLFLGYLGADQIYLGFPTLGALKFCTLGGFGVWWIIDTIRIGSAPVYAYNYRVANDLPHWAFVLSYLTFLLVVSFLFVGYYTLQQRAKRRRDVLLLQQEEEAQRYLDEIHPRGMKRYGLPSSFGPPSFDEFFTKDE